jgi:hypothetical protein
MQSSIAGLCSAFTSVRVTIGQINGRRSRFDLPLRERGIDRGTMKRNHMMIDRSSKNAKRATDKYLCRHLVKLRLT